MIDLVAARCFHFIYIYACNLVSLCFLCCYRFSVNKDLCDALSIITIMGKLV